MEKSSKIQKVQGSIQGYIVGMYVKLVALVKGLDNYLQTYYCQESLIAGDIATNLKKYEKFIEEMDEKNPSLNLKKVRKEWEIKIQ